MKVEDYHAAITSIGTAQSLEILVNKLAGAAVLLGFTYFFADASYPPKPVKTK